MIDIRLYHKVYADKKKMNVEFFCVLTLFLIHQNGEMIAIFFIKKRK
ncbi:hypothetical protein K151_3224 [Proteus hauseri ZMd44]|nr:hypothetical protein K151_3224 [Proteus hauseri ZMd44]